jgi:hypothetical protein
MNGNGSQGLIVLVTRVWGQSEWVDFWNFCEVGDNVGQLIKYGQRLAIGLDDLEQTLAQNAAQYDVLVLRGEMLKPNAPNRERVLEKLRRVDWSSLSARVALHEGTDSPTEEEIRLLWSDVTNVWKARPTLYGIGACPGPGNPVVRFKEAFQGSCSCPPNIDCHTYAERLKNLRVFACAVSEKVSLCKHRITPRTNAITLRLQACADDTSEKALADFQGEGLQAILKRVKEEFESIKQAVKDLGDSAAECIGENLAAAERALNQLDDDCSDVGKVRCCLEAGNVPEDLGRAAKAWREWEVGFLKALQDLKDAIRKQEEDEEQAAQAR